MTQAGAMYDLVNNALVGCSIPPDEVFTFGGGDVNGSYVDLSKIQGPVHVFAMTGAASGSPTSFSIPFEVEEADDAGGTNNQVVSNQDRAAVTSDDGAAVGRAHLTKPFARIIIDDTDDTVVGGTAPAIEVTAGFIAQKRSF